MTDLLAISSLKIFRRPLVTLFFASWVLSSPHAETAASPRTYSTRAIEGWTVHINGHLLADEQVATEKALSLLQKQLAEIVRVVPAPAVAKLREVPLWFSPEYPGVQPRAEYHPEADWLRANGRDPAMAKGVEVTAVRDFERETVRMPNWVLHELAHAYHDRVLPDGFDNPEIKAAYETAKAGKRYDKVERWFGNGRPNTFESAYAMTSPMEYFAESTEAFFGRNDFFPFTREDLLRTDPEMSALLAKLWGVPQQQAGDHRLKVFILAGQSNNGRPDGRGPRREALQRRQRHARPADERPGEDAAVQ